MLFFRTQSNRAFDSVTFYQYFTFKDTYNEYGAQRYWYTSDQAKSELGIMDEIGNSDIVLMEQQNTYLTDTHIEFLDYVIANINDMYYHLGENVITKSDDQVGVSLTNFYPLEDWGRWTQGQECSFTIYQDPMEPMVGQDYQLRFTAYSYWNRQNCSVFVNGREIGSIVLEPQYAQEYELQIPSEYLSEVANAFTFCLDGMTVSLKDVGQGEDTRPLGIGFTTLSVEVN